MATQVGPISASPGLPGGNRACLDVAAATVVKNVPGICCSITVVSAGSTVGAVYDNSSTSGNSAANQFGSIPNAVGTYTFNWPCGTGITVVPGTGQTLAVSYT